MAPRVLNVSQLQLDHVDSRDSHESHDNHDSHDSHRSHDSHGAVRMLTWGADAVLVEWRVSPDLRAGLRVQHRPHHLVKRLVRVALQHHLLVTVDEAATEACDRHHTQSSARRQGGLSITPGWAQVWWHDQCRFLILVCFVLLLINFCLY